MICKKKYKYKYKVLWCPTYIGIAINTSENIPLTSFYFWPQNDGWTFLKKDLERKPWVPRRARIEMLNGYTKILNYWTKKNNTKNLNRIKCKQKTVSFEILGTIFVR